MRFTRIRLMYLSRVLQALLRQILSAAGSLRLRCGPSLWDSGRECVELDIAADKVSVFDGSGAITDTARREVVLCDFAMQLKIEKVG